jgi:hypothetical protein
VQQDPWMNLHEVALLAIDASHFDDWIEEDLLDLADDGKSEFV